MDDATDETGVVSMRLEVEQLLQQSDFIKLKDYCSDKQNIKKVSISDSTSNDCLFCAMYFEELFGCITF